MVPDGRYPVHRKMREVQILYSVPTASRVWYHTSLAITHASQMGEGTVTCATEHAKLMRRGQMCPLADSRAKLF